jgi:hypothetical protein
MARLGKTASAAASVRPLTHDSLAARLGLPNDFRLPDLSIDYASLG